MMCDNLQEFLKEAGPTVDRLLEAMRKLHVEKFQFTRPTGRVTLYCYEAPPSTTVSEDAFKINLKIDPKHEPANSNPITTATTTTNLCAPITTAGNKGDLNIPFKRTTPQKDTVKPKVDPTFEAAATAAAAAAAAAAPTAAIVTVAPSVSGKNAPTPKTSSSTVKNDPNIPIKTALSVSNGDGVYHLPPTTYKKKMPLRGVGSPPRRRIPIIPYESSFYDYSSSTASSSSSSSNEFACAPPESRDEFFDRSRHSYMGNNTLLSPKTQRETKRGHMVVR